MSDSPYRISVEEFDRRTPRVHAHPVDPDDPDGEMVPATAVATVEHKEPEPSPYTVEGFIAGIGRIGSAASAGGVVGRRARLAQWWLLGLIVAPFLLAILVFALT